MANQTYDVRSCNPQYQSFLGKLRLDLFSRMPHSGHVSKPSSMTAKSTDLTSPPVVRVMGPKAWVPPLLSVTETLTILQSMVGGGVDSAVGGDVGAMGGGVGLTGRGVGATGGGVMGGVGAGGGGVSSQDPKEMVSVLEKSPPSFFTSPLCVIL
mmetsp:Transcript_30063/g.72600  ORF Transcript_30063/g.72600 Transcript_30063/m.72600 type:complete len:154 (-) Transcript_30063:33-494(-)